MFLARLWYLLAMLAAAALVGAAAGLPTLRDAELQAAEDARYAARGEALIAAGLADLRAAEQSLAVRAAHPELATLDSIGSLPAHIREAQLRKLLRSLSGDSAEPLLLLDGKNQVLAGAEALMGGNLAGHPILAAAARGGVQRAGGLLGIRIAGPEGPRALLIRAAPKLAERLTTFHEAAKDGSRLAVLGAPSAAAELIAVEAGPVSAVSLDDKAWRARRFALGKTNFVLAWPAVAPVALSPATLLERVDTTVLGAALGVAFLLWLIGVLMGGAALGRRGRKLAGDFEEIVGGSSLAPANAAAHPGWLRAAVEAANDAVEAAERAGRAAGEAAAAKAAAAAPKKRSKKKKRKAPAVSAAEATVEARSPRKVPDSGPPVDQASAPPPRPPAPEPTPEPVAVEPEPIAAEPEAEPVLTPAPPALPPEDEEGEEARIITVNRDAPQPEGPKTQPRVQQVPEAIGGSLFEMSLPALDEEDEADAEDHTDSDIRLPGAQPGRSGGGGSLLAALRSAKALQPEAAPASSGDNTQIKPMPVQHLAAADDSTSVGPAPTPALGEREAYYREVFEELVATKRSCGEDVELLDYERFCAKLERTRRALMGRFDCEDVRFRVYVKDERAALKAAPVVKESA